jgi:hypothetical protein
MKKIFSLMLGLALMCLTFGCTPYHSQGAGTGAVVGGVAGALLDSRNPWRGGVIGGVLGAVAGATIADISVRASEESYRSRKPVEYRTEDGRGVYRADPLSYNKRTKCRKIRERTWEDGRLVKDRTTEICKGSRYDRRY